ncbi:bifunctional metallophosphatase/5'-nucleotidase [Haloplasma contractile]|uniref:2'3'-cyclic-nucleotide 2'-phosphodiesterase protein n=1 Tax=Haloplasma contractile SSD-17B TaxID=1033810 RepID=U2DRW0_9MOLU|nr:bifunctional UDP-sugar hydrolase/5'-nucleotidase [Haloplasma contractile]ERJ11307.1 2'3'-cyclic-nucleotide 2'-phosphodiesterase protein [Haloplasma contractile SSD-17B]
MTFTLSVLSTTDLHGSVTSKRYSDNSEGNFGLAKIASLIKKERSKNPTLLIDNGDTIQGNALTYYDANIGGHNDQTPIAKVLNELNYDACVIGNHEFNYGLDYLKRYMTSLQCPTLSCNIKKKTGDFFASPYIIKNMDDGPKIAIIGATTHYIPNWEKPATIESLTFLDAYQSVKDTAKYIKGEHNVDCMIVAYHGGIEKDLKTGEPLAPLTGENQGYKMLEEIDEIDILLTGHQHRILNDDDAFGKAVTQGGSNGEVLSKIEIEFEKINDKWMLKDKSTCLMKCDHETIDQGIINLITPLEEKTQVWLDQTIGQVTNGELLINDPFKARLDKHKIVTLLNQIQMEISGADLSLVALGNYIKGFPKNITMRDVISTYIYPNTLCVLEVSGASLKEALEKTSEYFTVHNGEIKVSDAYLYPKPQHYNYDLYDGITYTIDLNEPVGRRIKDLTYKNHSLDMDQMYQVVMNNYRASGGGDYTMFKESNLIKEINTDMVEVITNYIRKHKQIDVPDIKNINIIY